MAEAEAVAALRRKLERYLGELFGGARVDPEGDFVIGRGSAVTWIRPIELPGERTGVRIWSITNVEMRVDDELTRFIATENGKLLFGVFHLEESRPALIFAHTLLGEFLNRKELEVAVDAVDSAADVYDDLVKARFGGRLFSET